MLGVVIVAVVQIGPLDTLADSVLVAHMLQHILISDIASLLIVFGLTGPVIQPLLHVRAPGRFGRSPTRSSRSRSGR